MHGFWLLCFLYLRMVGVYVWWGGGYQVSAPALALARRADRWSWDPDEERKRQERWQGEQERMLQV